MRKRAALPYLRTSNRILGAAVLVLASMSAINCWKDPLTPVPPSWDVNLTFPIAVKDVTLSDVIQKDSTSVRADASNRIVFSSIVQATPFSLADQLSIMPSASNAHVELGSFAVALAPMVADINPPAFPPGSTINVPPGTFQASDMQSSTGTSGSVTFKSGTVALSFKNNMPITITPSRIITVVDAQGATIAAFDFGGQPIYPTRTEVRYSDLAEKTVGSSVTVTGLEFTTPGSIPRVTFPTDSLLVATLSFDNAIASTAILTAVPSQRLIDNDRTTVTLDDSTMVALFAMKSGLLHFTFSNKIDLGVQFKFRVENLYKRMGSSLRNYEDSLYLSALGSANYTMDLTGCEFQSAPGLLLNTLELTSSVFIPDAVTEPVSVHDTDKVQIAMAPVSPIYVDTVKGALTPTWVNVNTAVGIDKGQFPSKLNGRLVIPSASLAFHFRSGIGYPADCYLDFTATRADGQTATLTIPADQRRIMPGGSTITFDPAEAGNFLSQFTAGLPDSVHISGKVLVNPPDCYTTDPLKVGGLSSAGSFGGTLQLSIPLTVGISQASYRDTVDFGLAEDGSNKKPGEDELKNINTAKLHIEIQNGIPADVSVRVHVLDAMHHELLTLPQSGGTLAVAAATVDAQGFAAAPGISNLEIELNHAEAQQYSAATYVDYEVALQTPQGGSTVTFRTTDFVHVRVWTECSMGVNK